MKTYTCEKCGKNYYMGGVCPFCTPKTRLYTVCSNVICVTCNARGAIKFYGAVYKGESRIHGAVGPGGTIPYECLSCGRTGLIDHGGFEGFKMQFRSIQDLKKNGECKNEFRRKK
jgi:hypothetical protein